LHNNLCTYSLTVSQNEVEQLKQKVPISKKLRKQPDPIFSEPRVSVNDSQPNITEEISPTNNMSIQHLNTAIEDLNVRVNNQNTVVEKSLHSQEDMANEILILKEEIRLLKYKKQQLDVPNCIINANNSGTDSTEHTSQINMLIEHFSETIRNLEAEKNNLKQVVEKLLHTQENMMGEILLLKKEISLLKGNITVMQ